jgi:pilus assembly protein TadC
MKILQSLQNDLVLADIDMPVSKYLIRSCVPAGIFALNLAVLLFFVLKGTGYQWVALPVLVVFFGLFMLLFLFVPKANARAIASAIEADLFVPSRMLVTLLESGNSILSAFERVSRTKTVSGKYFGKIAAEIYLGKNLDHAIEDAIRNSPSHSFRRVLEPIKNSIRTGAPIEKNLIATLEDLTQEKIVEIERYEKRLAPISMFYMIFGTILPAIGVVVMTVLLSVLGLKITFFPFLFIMLILVIIMQLVFLQVFKAIRPLVKL